MAQQLTTSLTDGILVWSVLYFIYNVFWINFFACLGLGIQGVAAGAGVLKFAQKRPASNLIDTHQMFTWLAQVVGLPLLAVGFCHKDLPVMMNLNMITMMGVLIGSRMMEPGMRKMATEACAGLGVATILIVCLRAMNIYGLMAVALYVVSGKVIGSEGKISIFLRVDALHIALTVANVLFAWALLRL